MPSMQFTIVPPTNVLEASTSVGSDDLSLAKIIVEAENTAGVSIRVFQISMTVAEFAPAGLSETISAEAGKTALTRRASAITAITAQPGAWEFGRVDSESAALNGRRSVAFLAKPTPPAAFAVLASGQKFTFILDTIEVFEKAGVSDLAIEGRAATVATDGTVGATETISDTLKIRKIVPDLRIDSFTADTLSLAAEGNVVLIWNTTSAEVITLEGLSTSEIGDFKIKFPSTPVETGAVAKSNSKEAHDDNFTVRPARTTTYTLRAFSGTANAEVIRQLAVTVAHPTASSAGQMTVGDAAFIRTQAGAGNLRVQCLVKATRFEGQGAVPVGAIVMWSGNVSDIPSDWALCYGVTRTPQDGSQKTPPDLRARFIIGTGTDDFGKTYNLLDRAGETEVKLTEATMPKHSHSTSLSFDKTLNYCEHDDSAANSSADFSVSAVAPIAGTKTILRRQESIQFSVSSTGEKGETGAHNNLPPYVALAYIMKLPLPVQ
jgi:microcystin-dependent protein